MSENTGGKNKKFDEEKRQFSRVLVYLQCSIDGCMHQRTLHRVDETEKLWSCYQGDVDLLVGQVGQVAPSAQQDPEDPGDKTQQIVSSQPAFMMRRGECGILNHKSYKRDAEREREKRWETECVCVCVCVCTHLVFYVLATESVLVCACASVYVCSVFVSLPLCRLAKPPVPKPHLWSPGKWLIWKYNHSGQDFISSLSESISSLFPLLSRSPPTKFLSWVGLSLPRFSHRSLSRIEAANSSPFSCLCCLTQLP